MPRTWNKADLAEAVAEKSGLNRKDAAAAIDALVDTITGALRNRDKVQLLGFGAFETRRRKQRRARNMQTKEEMIVPASTVPAFRAGRALKDAVK